MGLRTIAAIVGTCCTIACGSDDSPSTDELGPLSFEVAWTTSSVVLSIRNGVGGYRFGMADTDSANPVPWSGEDCLHGYTATTGVIYSYCHAAQPTGTILLYGGSWNSLQPGTTNLEQSDAATTTYYVASETGDCWVSGRDPSYYSGLDCTVIAP